MVNTNYIVCSNFALTKIVLQSLSSAELERQAAVQKLIASEEKFMKTLTAGFDAYLRPLRQAVITKHEHNMLFQNIEFVSIAVK